MCLSERDRTRRSRVGIVMPQGMESVKVVAVSES